LSILIAILLGATYAFGTFVPFTIYAELLCGAASFLAVFSAYKSKSPIRDFFFCGLAFRLIICFWLPSSYVDFGRISLELALPMYVLFSVIMALKFVLVAVIFLQLRKTILNKLGLSLALAWLVAELFFPNIFNWSLAHPFIRLSSFSSLAEYLSLPVLSALLIYVASLLSSLIGKSELDLSLPSKGFGFIAVGVLLIFGSLRTYKVEQALLKAPSVRLGLIQGNLKAVHDETGYYLEKDHHGVYRKLTDEAVSQGAEVVLWPETIFPLKLRSNLKKIEDKSYLPHPNLRVPLMYGSASLKPKFGFSWGRASRKVNEEKAQLEDFFFKFNSVFTLGPNGVILGRYHKRVLMPFGEYVPMGNLFPWLKHITPETGDYTPGPKTALTSLLGGKLKVGTLICYEDLIPGLAKDLVNEGANILINFTDDVWFGDSPAAYQHNLFAAWRAIETRRSLVRVTNSGVSSVIDPLGRVQFELPAFTSKGSVETVYLVDNEAL